MAISCGIYSFTGSSIPVGVETFQVNYFENTAGGKPGSTIEPGLDRDFTIATVVSPTILVEPEKTEETVAEGETLAEGASEGAEDATSTEEGKDKTTKPTDEKAKTASGNKDKVAKPSDNKAKTAPSDKSKTASKETKKK